MNAVIEVVERDDKGKFVESPDSLYPRTIGLRLHRTHYKRFVELARKMGKRPTEVARDVLELWIDSQGEVVAEEEKDT